MITYGDQEIEKAVLLLLLVIMDGILLVIFSV